MAMVDFLERQITEKGWLSVLNLYFDNSYTISVYNTRGMVAYSKNDQCFFAMNPVDSLETEVLESKVLIFEPGQIGQQVGLTVAGEEHLQHYDLATYTHFRNFFTTKMSEILLDPLPSFTIPNADEVKAMEPNPDTGLYDGTDTITMLGLNQLSTIGMYDKSAKMYSGAIVEFWKNFYKNHDIFLTYLKDQFGVSSPI